MCDTATKHYNKPYKGLMVPWAQWGRKIMQKGSKTMFLGKLCFLKLWVPLNNCIFYN